MGFKGMFVAAWLVREKPGSNENSGFINKRLVTLPPDGLGYYYCLVANLCPTPLWPHGLICSPPASSVHGISQARILEWVAIFFSRGSSWPRDQTRISIAAAAAKSFQLCLTLWDPMDCSPPGSLVPGILQARTPEWVAISFSKAWKWKVKVRSLSGVWLLATPWTADYQAPPSMGFSGQQYWSGVSLPSPRISIRQVLKRTEH